ncbi:peroxisomal membrane protein 2 [Diachasmimorpha longicaudata]|uniref:peroxisomal membrane protein 2 n=1 Tax=Diachasmimorpha longicaudata TaxID=58733 RepID=UPI0030B88AC4
MSLSKNILKFVKKPLVFNSLIYGSFYTSAEFLQQTYQLQERKKEISAARALTVAESTTPLVVIGSQSQSVMDSSEKGKATDTTLDEAGYNWPVLQRYVVYGYFLAGPILHQWYLWLDRFYVGTAGATLVKKLFFDQFILTPPLIVLFFSSMSLMEGKEDLLGECKAKFIKTFQTSCLYWLPMQFINFLIIPAKFRVVFVSVAAFLWVNILCHLKRAPIANNEQ